MRILITGGSGFIGTNLLEKLISTSRHTILNLDIAEPKIEQHRDLWKDCDILDGGKVLEMFRAFKPDVVVHLAARTDTDPKRALSEYAVNTKGTQNVLTAIKDWSGIKRLVMTSTQFVHQYQGLPKSDVDYVPHTLYGESKVIAEKMTREAGLDCVWTIIRPTNIWGPWHIRYPYEFWAVLSKGLYVHPGRKPVVRSYGYVGNVVYQIISILEAPLEKIDKKVFYVGDMPIDLYDWVNGFSLAQTGKPVRVVPRVLVRVLAWVGDALLFLNIKFPLTSSRFRSMTNSNDAPMMDTIASFGQPPYSLQQGIDETLVWMKRYHPNLVRQE